MLKIIFGLAAVAGIGTAFYMHHKLNACENVRLRRGAVLNKLGVDIGLVDAGRWDEALPPALHAVAFPTSAPKMTAAVRKK